MQYMFLFVDERENVVHDMDAWRAYMGAMHEAGIMKYGDELHPNEAATTLRIRDGKRSVQDGPYADVREQLGGFVVVEVPDLDTALDWAAKSPAAELGCVEVRPVVLHDAPAPA
ncbi:YciI family protein [Pontivivens ytuae]|uniref:YciI family protein n=1 Tax=Pontivivens ytuae TaxID=2789856 RepID=A0A7S9LUI7_9RHOB|nr:YciI family protein [Pontivivens ytuae]QPH55005.1 YciI family protein [Pontivivens ytuae]